LGTASRRKYLIFAEVYWSHAHPAQIGYAARLYYIKAFLPQGFVKKKLCLGLVAASSTRVSI
jgi:hypothetical protein